MPSPPDSLSELNRWKDELDGFKYYIINELSIAEESPRRFGNGNVL